MTKIKIIQVWGDWGKWARKIGWCVGSIRILQTKLAMNFGNRMMNSVTMFEA
jgi:hypothetical protein